MEAKNKALQRNMEKLAISTTPEKEEKNVDVVSDDLGKAVQKGSKIVQAEPKETQNKQTEAKKGRGKTSSEKEEEDWTAFSREVNRAIYGDTSGYPASGSADYYKSAQNYALHGSNFMDFSKDLSALWGAPAGQPKSGGYGDSSRTNSAPATNLKYSRFSKFFTSEGASAAADKPATATAGGDAAIGDSNIINERQVLQKIVSDQMPEQKAPTAGIIQPAQPPCTVGLRTADYSGADEAKGVSSSTVDVTEDEKQDAIINQHSFELVKDESSSDYDSIADDIEI